MDIQDPSAASRKVGICENPGYDHEVAMHPSNRRFVASRSMERLKRLSVLLLPGLFLGQASSFLTHPNFAVLGSSSSSLSTGCRRRCTVALHQQSTARSDGDGAEVASLRVSEIRSELTEMGVDFSDCFDKESLIERLKDARVWRLKVKPGKEQGKEGDPSHRTNGPPPSAETTVSLEELLKALRAMSVRDLRQELASRNLRWAGFLEKEDLVQAVRKAREEASSFSVTGKIAPGQVATLNGDDVRAEIASDGVSIPLLLDVYAVWCGKWTMARASWLSRDCGSAPNEYTHTVPLDQDPAK